MTQTTPFVFSKQPLLFFNLNVILILSFLTVIIDVILYHNKLISLKRTKNDSVFRVGNNDR